MREVREALEYHASMLVDEPRVSAYRRAIEQTVRPGDVVVDIGTGTGVLALMAARAGARRVYAIEAGLVADVAEKVLAANDPEQKVVLLRGMSQELSLPEPADVLVSEIIWNVGLGEGILSAYADAQARLLAPGARVIPQRLHMWLAPVESPVAFEAVDVWTPSLAGFDYASIRSLAANIPYPRYFREESRIAPPGLAGSVELGGPIERTFFSGGCEFAVERDATLHGLAGWFSTELADGVTLDNAPPSRSSWMQAYFPVEAPVPLAAGDPVKVRVAVLSDDEHWQWTVDAGGRRQQASTLVRLLSDR